MIHPDAVVTGAAAAFLTWWPQVPVDAVTATRSGTSPTSPGYVWEERSLDGDLLTSVGPVMVAGPALCVLDLIPAHGGAVIDEALRRRAATLGQMWEALEKTPGRAGNQLRRRLLDDSRDQPWSEAERDLHRIYRDADLAWDYRTNYPVRLGGGRLVYLDLALPELGLGIEADGWAFHGSRAAFESDRDRDAALLAHGWMVVRFSAAALATDPELVSRRLAAIASWRAESSGGRRSGSRRHERDRARR